MMSNRWMIGGALALCLVWSARAQEQPAEPQPDPGDGGEAVADESPTEPAPEKKSRWKEFFGDRNALYVEFGVAGGSFDDIDASVSTSTSNLSYNNLSIDSVLGGRAAIGWTLPFDRGRYLLSFEGFKEDAYTFDAAGMLSQLARQGGGFRSVDDPVQWWTVRASDSGRVDGTRNPPIWNDANGNNIVDPGEVAYGTPDLTFSSGTTDTLKNTVQTWDLLYQRDWGGRRFRGSWSAGVRYSLYEGTIPLAAWLGTESSSPGVLYTDGTATRLLPLSQKTEGWGPTGSGEAQYNFARGRVILYLQARGALVLQNMNADTGPFVTYARDSASGFIILAPARLQESLDKTVWQLAGELGARIRILPGTHLLLAYSYRGYLDSVLIPAAIQVPQTDAQAGRGTIGLFKSLDLRVQSFHAGLSFQF